MPRKPRLFVPGGTYHVYCRVARGEFVFDDALEAASFVEVVREVRDLDGWRIFAWCLMGNHYHLVIRTGEVPLWRSMARLQGRVARGFNRRRRYLGRLWQSRYRARVVDSPGYFRQAVCYVHLNPVAAHIVSDPAEYMRSGHREILGTRESMLIDTLGTLSGFSGRGGEGGRNAYLGWLRAVAEARWFAEGVVGLPWWTGAKDMGDIADAATHPDVTTFDGRRLATDRRRLNLEQFVARFERHSGHSAEELATPLRSEKHILGRIELTLLAVNRYGLRSCDIANLLCKARTSVSRWLAQGLRLERSDPVFRNRVDALDRAISAARDNKETIGNVAP